VRDVTDLTHPVTRCGLSGGANLRFINSTRISYIVTSSGDLGAAGSLYLVDLATSTTSLVRAWASGGYASWVYNWSHDGQKLSYLSSDSNGVKWHVLSAAGDKVLASLGTVPGRGVNLDNDDAMVGFSADGQYVAVEETFTAQKDAQTSTPPIQIVRLSDYKTVYTRADGTMGTWGASGARFYFRTGSGVQVWEATGKVQTVQAGLQWIRPWPSADGSHIAYTTLDPQGNHKVGIIDTNGGPLAQASSEPRANPGYRALPNTFLLPHLGSATIETRFDTLLRILSTQLPLEQAVSEKLARVEGSVVAARSLPRMFDLSDRRRA